jgi:prepilin peptidase CpaA
MSPYLVPLLAAAAAGVAAFTDLRARRIPNWLTFTTLAVGLGVHAATDGLSGCTWALSGVGLGLALLLPFYLLRAMGAGDVKLLGALGALVGPQSLLSIAVYGALVGGVMSVAALIGRRRLLLTLSELLVQRTLPTRSGATAPYGLAIASGVYLWLVLPAVVR